MDGFGSGGGGAAESQTLVVAPKSSWLRLRRLFLGRRKARGRVSGCWWRGSCIQFGSAAIEGFALRELESYVCICKWRFRSRPPARRAVDRTCLRRGTRGSIISKQIGRKVPFDKLILIVIVMLWQLGFYRPHLRRPVYISLLSD